MKLLALAVLLAVMQATPPSPRQTANNSTGTPANVQSKSAADQKRPLPVPAAIEADANGTTKGNSGEQHPADAEHTVVISKVPPVSVMKDSPDRGIWWFNLLLVVVGGLQAIILLMQWRLFRRQTIFQEVGFTQWIELVEWRVEPSPILPAEILDVSFGIYNPSDYLMTIQFVCVDINGQQTNLNLMKTLPRNRTTHVGISLSVTAEQKQLRQDSSLPLFIDGYIEFINILKAKQSQLFRGGIVCDKMKAVFVDCTKAPTDTTQKKDKQVN
jgi:hypothetical protein